jgi:hypothetical protein
MIRVVYSESPENIHQMIYNFLFWKLSQMWPWCVMCDSDVWCMSMTSDVCDSDVWCVWLTFVAVICDVTVVICDVWLWCMMCDQGPEKCASNDILLWTLSQVWLWCVCCVLCNWLQVGETRSWSQFPGHMCDCDWQVTDVMGYCDLCEVIDVTKQCPIVSRSPIGVWIVLVFQSNF